MAVLKNYTKEERRRFERIEDDVFIFYRSQRDKQRAEAIARDIGGGGLMFKTDKALLLQDILELEIYEPVDINKKLIVAIDAMARVVWIKRLENNPLGSDRLAVGLEFMEIKREDRVRITNYIAKRKK